MKEVTYDDFGMSYQALLFSADEKASRVVSQILNELEFHVEVCNEPFAAVKQITNQHYDALVVDCDNEQNATLLFKSARNSNSNGESLAVALVQGQGGIAKAFRIGANLVLTKPIHPEQSKGTLRTARGLLRKAEAAKAAAASAAGSPSSKLEDPTLAAQLLAALPDASIPGAITNDSSVTSMAIATLETQPGQSPELGAEEVALLESMTTPASVQIVAPEAATAVSASVATGSTEAGSGKSASVATASTANSWQSPTLPAEKQVVVGSSSGAAAATAPAKEVAPSLELPVEAAPSVSEQSLPTSSKNNSPKNKKAKKSVAEPPPVKEAAFAKSRDTGDGINIGPLPDDASPSEETGSKKNFLIAAVLVFACAGALYYGWPQLQPLLNNIPIVQKYLGSAPPAPAPVAASPRVQSSQPPAPPADGSLNSTPSQTAATEAVPASAENDKTTAFAPAPDSTGSAQSAPELDSAAAAGLLLTKVDPVYPPSALQEHFEGSVKLQANIGKDGSPSHIKVLSGKAPFAAAAAAAVHQWKYKPYELNGAPTAFQTEITVDFKLP